MKQLLSVVALGLFSLAACGGGGGSGSNIADLAKNAGPITAEGEEIAQGTLNSIQSTSANTSSLGSSSSKSLALYKETIEICDGLTFNINESNGNITMGYDNVDFSDCFGEDLLAGAIFNGSMSIVNGNPMVTSGNIAVDYNDTPVEITREDSTTANCVLNGSSNGIIDGSTNLDSEHHVTSFHFSFHSTGDVDLTGDIDANVVYDIEVVNAGTDYETATLTCSGQMVITRSGSSAELCNVNGDCTGCL